MDSQSASFTWRPKVLVVDDDPRTAAVLARMLGADGFEVETCFDGVEALTRLEQARFSALVTDLEMPRLGGLELLRACRARLDGAALFAMSAYAGWQDEGELARLGVKRRFTKPLDYEALLVELRSATNGSAPPDPKGNGSGG